MPRLQVKRRLLRLSDDRRGATAVEYGLIIALVVLAVLGGMRQVGASVHNMWDHVSTSVINAN